MEMKFEKKLEINDFKILFNEKNKDDLKIKDNPELINFLGRYLFFSCIFESSKLLIIFEIDENYTPKFVDYKKHDSETDNLFWEQNNQIFFS